MILLISITGASLEGGQGGQLTTLEFWTYALQNPNFSRLTTLEFWSAKGLTPLGEIPNEASA